jgi:hypothetical protein
MSEEDHDRNNVVQDGALNTISYDMYIISDKKLYKRDSDRKYKEINLNGLEGFKNFENDEDICKFLKEMCEKLGYETKNMTGGGSTYQFNDNKTIAITDNTNPLAILKILKCLGFKTYKINEIKYIQSCEQWKKLYSSEETTQKEKDESNDEKQKRESLLAFLTGCVDFINRNLGLLNDFSNLLNKSNDNGDISNVSQELSVVKESLQNEICNKLKEIIENKNYANVTSDQINELNTGSEALVAFIKMMNASPSEAPAQIIQDGGFSKNNIFNNKCGDRFTNVLNKLSGAVEERYVVELKKNINNLNKNANSLNKKLDQMVGGGSCTDTDFATFDKKIQDFVNKSTAMSFALFELLKISKANGIEPETTGESIEIQENDISTPL